MVDIILLYILWSKPESWWCNFQVVEMPPLDRWMVAAAADILVGINFFDTVLSSIHMC